MTRAYLRGEESAAHKVVTSLNLEQTSAWKGRVAEAATLLRLVLRGYEPMRTVFEGDSVDWLVRLPDERIVRLQVRWAHQGRGGAPTVNLRSWDGKRHHKYEDGKIDFIVGYDLFTDISYVFSWAEVRGKTAVSVRPDAIERWDKLISL